MCLFFFRPIPCSFSSYSSIVEFEVRDGDACGSSFIVQEYFSYPWFFCFFHMKLSIVLSRSVKKCIDFEGDCVESVHCFW